MIGTTISHYEIGDKPGEGGPNCAKASLGRPVHQSPIKQSKGNR